MLNVQIYTFFFNCRNLAPIFRRILNFLARETAFCRELNDRKRQEDAAGWAGCLKSRKNLCAVLIQIARRLRRSNKRRYANIRRRSGAQQTIMRASENLRCEGAIASFPTLVFLDFEHTQRGVVGNAPRVITIWHTANLPIRPSVCLASA